MQAVLMSWVLGLPALATMGMNSLVCESLFLDLLLLTRLLILLVLAQA